MPQRMALQPRENSRTHLTRAAASRRETLRRGLRLSEAALGVTVCTITHAGRQIRFGPVEFWIAAGSLAIIAAWSIVTAAYFALHDDAIETLISRQRAQQYAYEKRLSAMRTRIDRATKRQLLDQEQFEQKLNELLRRQASLQSRADALREFADPETTGGIESENRGTGAGPRQLALHQGMLALPQHLGKLSSIQLKLLQAEASLNRIERREFAVLDRVQARYEGRLRRIGAMLSRLGVRFSAVPFAIGGPFVPVKLPSRNDDFARALTSVSIARAKELDLAGAIAYVPLRRPLAGVLEVSSPFGVRIDPFLHEPSMHTGLDLRGSIGEPVHATAAGKVTIAGWDGGYGELVEIDHGEGLSTRYGHLSQIDVSVGQKVRAGAVIGRLGSTGRSTGPHLHYETRVNGEAVNPQSFLAAGTKLFAY